MSSAGWAQIGGRPGGFVTCDANGGNTCCTKVDPKLREKACVRSACREHNGAKENKPGHGNRDNDCCGAKGNRGCDAGYKFSLKTNAAWAKIGGRAAGFVTCDA